MPGKRTSALRGAAFAALAAVLLASCDGGDGTIPGNQPTPTPTPTPTATGNVAYDVSRCFDQIIPGTGGRNLDTQIVPDTLKLDINDPNGFPNGRDFDDPVIDLILAMFFLDLSETGQSIRTFADLPLNPGGNDISYQNAFPFIGPQQGNPPPLDTSPTTYDFRTDPDTAYVRVDRMGQPAIATALVSSPVKTPYNDRSPVDDAAGQFEQELRKTLAALNVGIGDDLTNIGLKLCARRL